MSTSYPAGKQTFTDITPGSAGTSMGSGNLHSTLHNDANDTIEALQDLVGYAAAPPAPLIDRVAALESVAARTLFDYYADAGNVSTSETDLYADDVPADTLAAFGDKLSAYYGGSFVDSGTATRQLRVYFAAALIFDSGALTLSLPSAWKISVEIVRNGANTARYVVTFNTHGATQDVMASAGEVGGLDFATDLGLKITGEASGTGADDDDIVAVLGSVRFIPKA